MIRNHPQTPYPDLPPSLALFGVLPTPTALVRYPHRCALQTNSKTSIRLKPLRVFTQIPAYLHAPSSCFPLHSSASSERSGRGELFSSSPSIGSAIAIVFASKCGGIVFVAHRPPLCQAMNHVKVRPRREAIFYWYTASTYHFHQTDSVSGNEKTNRLSNKASTA